MAHNPDLSHGPGGSDPGSDSGVGGGSGGGGRSAPSYRSSGRDKWWKIHLFRGMVKDVRRRAPYYWSDWRDAWDYRVVPATIYMYFAKYGWKFLGRLPSLSLSRFPSCSLSHSRVGLPLNLYASLPRLYDEEVVSWTPVAAIRRQYPLMVHLVAGCEY